MMEIKDYAVAFIMVIAVLAIGGSVAVLAVGQSTSIMTDPAGLNSTVPAWYTSATTSAGNALSVFASLLPILAIALIGGISLFYLMRFIAGSSNNA